MKFDFKKRTFTIKKLFEKKRIYGLRTTKVLLSATEPLCTQPRQGPEVAEV